MYKSVYTRHSIPSFSKVTNYDTSVFLYNSSSVAMYNMNIIAAVMTNFTAILIVNTQGDSKVINIKVKINSFNCTTSGIHVHPLQISGLVAYYSEGIFNDDSKLTITNFYYNNTYNTACENRFNCIVVLLFWKNTCNSKMHFPLELQVHIQNSVFSNLKNSSVLCYYGHNNNAYSCRRRVMITNSTFSNNTGYPQLNMFYIVLNSLSQFSLLTGVHKHKSLQNNIKFSNCIFTRNVNMEAIIYIRPPTTYVITGHIAIRNSTFHKNINTSFIKVRKLKESWNVFYFTTYLMLYAINISCNEHDDGDNLIFITNAQIMFIKSVLNENSYYENIINLQFSLLVVSHYTEISRNYARYIVKAQSNSFLFMTFLTTINISNNVVYKTTKVVSALEKHIVSLCPLQMAEPRNTNHTYRFLLLSNIEMISKALPTEITSYFNRNCTMSPYYTTFQKLNVSQKSSIVQSNNTFVNKITKKEVNSIKCLSMP